MGAPEAMLESDEAEVSHKIIFEFQRKDSFFATEVDMTQPLEYPIGLSENDNYRIKIKPGADTYIYVFQLNSEDVLIRLFPDDLKNMINPVAASEEFIIPGSDTWYHLDDLTGEEKIYLVTAPQEVPELTGSYEKYGRTRSASKQEIRRKEIIDQLEELGCEVMILENQ